MNYKALNAQDRKNEREERGQTEHIDYAYMKAITNSIKAFQGCFVCGYDEHPQALDYHHLDNTEKNFNIAAWSTHAKSEDDIHKELAKCIVLCSNCHRVIHSYMGKKM